MPGLGVNIDHIATLREARGGKEPDPIRAAVICEMAGCDSIVAHLREDRRHINDDDVKKLRKAVKTMFNLEMSVDGEIVSIAKKIKPDQATLVPEKRQELTTEGGMCVTRQKKNIENVIKSLGKSGIEVSIFIDPDTREIEAARETGARIIEIHTGQYSLAGTKGQKESEFRKIVKAAKFAIEIGFTVNAGHGLNYENASRVAAIDGMNEINIGHSIISQAAFSGLYRAVKDMKRLVK